MSGELIERPGIDDFILEYLDEQNLIIINYFYDEFQPHSCAQWGIEGNDKLPIIINDGDFNDMGLDKSFFYYPPGQSPGVPKHIFINKNMEIHYMEDTYMSKVEIKKNISEILEDF